MKRGGEEIYVGPVGQNSANLIEYFEVRRSKPAVVRHLVTLVAS